MEDHKLEQNESVTQTQNRKSEGSSNSKKNKALKKVCDNDQTQGLTQVEDSYDPNINIKKNDRIGCENDGHGLVTVEVPPAVNLKESQQERPPETCDIVHQGTEEGKIGKTKEIYHALKRFNQGSSNPVVSLESNQDIQIICLDDKDDLSKDVLTADKSTLDVLGEGTFGRVLKSAKPAHANCLIKEFRQGKKINPNEVIVPMKLNSPHMLKVYAVGFDLSDKTCRIVMQNCGKDLLKLLGDSKFMEYLKDFFNFCKFIVQLFSAVGELEDLKVVHGDLKLQNVTAKWVNDSYKLSVIDFGSCLDINERLNINGCTPEFLSPDFNSILLRGIKKEVDPETLKKIDSWAVGVIGFCLLNKGTHPVSVANYHGKKVTDEERRSVQEKISKLEQSDVDKWTPLDDGSFLLKALRGSVRIDPNERIGAKETAKQLVDNIDGQRELERASVKGDDPWAVKNKSMQDEIFNGDGNERKRKRAQDEEDKRQRKSAKFPPFLKNKE